ncbi:MAG: hypothetical protein WC227_04280 [Patescibacteria group bacterium]|jgi:hypothetical protein
MKRFLIKFGSYLVLIIGIIIAALILIFVISLLVNFPDASLLKKILVIAGLLISAIAVFALAFSVFESMHDLLLIEDQLKQILARKRNDD